MMATQTAFRHYLSVSETHEGVAWLETLVLSALALGLGWWFSPADPLLLTSEFPWVILAPLLVGMRYGFVRALASSVLLLAALFVFRVQGLAAYDQVPASFIVGVLLCSGLVGEFRDLWMRRLERLELANEYRQMRLDEFTRAHHLLRISHDRLERRIAGNDQSLRSSLLGLRRQFQALPCEGDPLAALADAILALLAPHGALRKAGLYRVDAQGRLQSRPLASLGEPEPLAADDLLARLCLERGELVSIRQELLEQGEQGTYSQLQLCIPLADVEGNVLALVGVRQMPFFMFHERNFNLLAILAGHIADLLISDRAALALESYGAQSFSQHLKRCLRDADKHELPASLFAFELPAGPEGEELLRLLEASRRGLDIQLQAVNGRGLRTLLVLLPLTSGEGAQGYLSRVQLLLGDRYGQQRSLEDLGVRSHGYQIEGGGERAAVERFLYNECGLDDKQVVV